ncbi:YdcF family protein [Roseomonas sp. M0104]|uniref:YdcF family protein n=1 Tax=Teichococcus coralli TaxID=2545983 RepID=A0A845BA05_9PROT|nr:YdcF family protein [Pseudoroseomonas coralli]
MTRPAIIIFGAAVRADGGPSLTLRRRVMAAASFGATLEDPLYIPTGGQGRHGPPEAEVMARLLQDLGVPAAAIRLELTATDTFSSARACARMLRGHDGPVFAASSGYHLPRCVMLLRAFGLPARAAPPPEAAHGWQERWWWRGREALALPYDAVLAGWERLRRRRS